jgi:arylsulfatase A-like enzyme
MCDARDRYDREIRSVDDELRAFFAVLDEAGLAETTIVTILSDHGEEFAEHGGFQHGGVLYEESVRVPLLFWGPGRIPAGRRHATPVSLIDVAPTLLDLLGLPVPADIDGVSLEHLIVDGRALHQRPLFAEAQARQRWIDATRREPWNPPLFAVRTGASKYILHRPAHGPAAPPVRFDLSRDPGETRPLPVEPGQARAVEALLARHLRGAEDAATSGAEADDVSPDLLERLRALGYAE